MQKGLHVLSLNNDFCALPKHTLFILCAVFLFAAGSPAEAVIQHTPGGFLITGTTYSVLINDTNGSLVSMSGVDGQLATGGAKGLWSLAYTNSGLHTDGTIQASSFSSGSTSNHFTWSLPAPSNTLYLTYSNADLVVDVTLTQRVDSIDLSAELTSQRDTLLALTLPAELRFDPSALDRFIAPSHSSDGVGMAYNSTFFEVQTEDTPATWKKTVVGPAGYIDLYGSQCIFTNYAPVDLHFTTSGVDWLGADVSNTWSGTSATVHRPPAPGQADVVLLDSTNGAFFSGSHLGGGAGAGWLMRIGGLVDRTRVDFSLDVVVGAIEHLAPSADAGRTNIALLNMARAPVIGESWPSEVRMDEWRDRIANSTVLETNGISLIELTNVEEMTNALAGTSYFAVLNPYGELVPASLSGGVQATTTNIGEYVTSGGHWFEVAGYSFYQALEPELYYTNNILYPPAFADFLQMEATNGYAAVFGVQPVPDDPWAGETNTAQLFIPGEVAWGGDAQGGYYERSFAPYIVSNATWQSPTVRLLFGQPATNALAAYVEANDFSRSLTNKMSPSVLDAFRQSVTINYRGVCTQLTANLPDLPAPAILHIAQYMYGGFDKEYPDHLPPNAEFGTPAEFTNFLAKAHGDGHLVMPYTNPTFWGEDPRGPTFTSVGEDPLSLHTDGSTSYEVYFGEGGYTVTPWHPEVRAANERTRQEFTTNYPIDILFQDQVGARTWQYDLNTNSPTPYAYAAGLAAYAGEDSRHVPVSTENGWDRIVNHEAQFCGLAWGLAPTTNAPFWRRYLRERYEPSTWEVFPMAQYIAHDKVAFVYNNLDAGVHNHPVISWTLGLGYGMTYVLNPTDLDNVDKRQWLLWIDRLQKSVVARYMGASIGRFDHRWGTNAVNPDNGVIEAQYGSVDVVANLGPDTLATNDFTLAPYGYMAEAPGLLAGHIMESGGSGTATYVAQTNSTGLDFWIYAPGNTNVTIVLPQGYNGRATVKVAGGSTGETEIVDNKMTVALGPGTDNMLWSGSVVVSAPPAVLVDFGSDSSYRGTNVANPDINGAYWNSVHSGAFYTNLVDTANQLSGIKLGFDAATGADSFNGPAGVFNADDLGALGVTNAVNDFYVSSRFQLQGLDTARIYRLTFYGSHKFSTDASTLYSVHSDNAYTDAVASVKLDVQQPSTAWLHNTSEVAVIEDLVPQVNARFYIDFEGTNGNAGYLNALMIESAPLASPTNLTAGMSGNAIQLNWNWSGGGSGFAVQRRVQGADTWTDLGLVGSAARTYMDNTVIQGVTYEYQVAALTADSRRGFYSVSTSLTADTNPTFMVFGSSVAKGWNGGGSYTNGSYEFGYAGRLTPVVEAGGWTVTNASVPGISTPTALPLFESRIVPEDPDVLLIALSLGNEGLSSNPDSDAVFESFRSGMTNLIYRSRTNGFYPAITLAYPHGLYTPTHYEYVKRMNLLMNTWNIPSINLLGATDDGQGQWAAGYVSDNAHPNTAGHAEMFYAIVPSLLDAIRDGKTNSPPLAGTHGYARLQGAEAQPLTFTPTRSIMHGYNAAFRVRAGATGTVAAVMTSTGAPPSATRDVFLIDFGRHDDGTNGTATASPDANGNYWNNISPANAPTNNLVTIGTSIANMVTTGNVPTTAGLEITSSGWAANGRLNGGLFNPSNALLAHFAVETATEDYFFTSGTNSFTITGLKPNGIYTLRFFGTRDSTSDRVTSYTVGSTSVTLQTSGSGIGTYSTNQNDNTIVELAGLSPDAGGSINVTVAKTSGSYAHLGIMEIAETGTLGPQGSTIEIRDNQLVYLAAGGQEIVADIDADAGQWYDVALSHSYVRGLTLLYVDGVLAGTLSESMAPVQFVLGGPGALTNRPPAPAESHLQDWCIYRAPWTPEEAMAQHTGALQQASMEIGAPLNDSSFVQGESATNLAQSLSLAVINETNITAATGVTPPGNLQVTSPMTNTAVLSWTDNSSTETGYVVERRAPDTFWSNIVLLAAGTTGFTNTSVDGGVYQYRVASQEGSLLSDYSDIVSVTVTSPPPYDQRRTYREWASDFFALGPVTYLLDFNTSAGPDYGGVTWNTVTSLSASASYVLTDTNDTSTGYTLSVADAFDQFRSNNGNPLAAYDDDAQSTLFAITDGSGQIVLSNLNREASYDATIFARRSPTVGGYDYRGQYTFRGGLDDINFVMDGGSNEVSVSVYGLRPDGVHSLWLEVEAPDVPTGTVFAGVSLLALREINGPGPFLIDFNTSSPTYAEGEMWNTVTSRTDATPYTLLDVDGSTADGYTLTLNDGFDQFRSDNAQLPGGFDDGAEATCFALRDDVPLVGQMTFSGLDTNLLYDFTVLARRGNVVGGFDYSGTYTFTGAVTTAVTIYGATNRTFTEVPGLAPDDAGNISLTVSAGPGAGTDFPLLNLLRLSHGGTRNGISPAAEPFDDADGDGIDNITEYARHQTPTNIDANTFMIDQVDAAAGSGVFKAYYDRYTEAGDAVYLFESTTNLLAPDWQPDAAVVETIFNEGPGDEQTIEIERTLNEQHLYLRLKMYYEP